MSSERDFDKEILDCLSVNSFGLTISDIAKKIVTTRNTVYRYLGKLEGQGQVFQKKVGRYVLYFSKEKRMEYLDTLLPIYKSFITGLTKEFPNKEEVFKKIGRGLADNFTLSAVIEGYEQIDSIKEMSNKQLFELLKNLLPFVNLFDNNIQISISNINEEKNKVTYLIKNSTLLENGNIYSYHFNILAGFLEEKLSKILGKTLKCEILEAEIFDKKENNYIKLSVEIS